jgi:DNA polymerase (family 10)
MTNKAIAQAFALLGKLTELHDNNAFRARSYNNASFRIKKLDRQLEDMEPEAIAAQPGFGAAIQAKIAELLDTGKMAKLDEYLAKTPEGILDILSIKGLGAKKVAVIWRELDVESPGELLYACRENRLAMLKGFGAKTQQSVIDAIEFWQQQAGLHHWASLEAPAMALEAFLMEHCPRVEASGAFRRKAPTLERIEFLAAWPKGMAQDALLKTLQGWPGWTAVKTVEPQDAAPGDATPGSVQLQGLIDGHYAASVLLVEAGAFNRIWFQASAAPAHLEELPEALDLDAGDEAAIYASADLAWIPPELREGHPAVDALSRAREHTLPKLLEAGDIRGVVHNHSTWSDGGASVEAMAQRCIERGYEYLVMSDHSRTAVYAGGLSIERVEAQWDEIDALNEKLAPFRIFKAIESDILADGSLDYPGRSQGHRTPAQRHRQPLHHHPGPSHRPLAPLPPRLSAGPSGHHRRLCRAEVNANPWRLDLDWTWIPAAMEAGVPISINPDAHALDGIDDIRYGVFAARKGGLTAEACWNARSREAIEAYLSARKERAGAGI